MLMKIDNQYIASAKIRGVASEKAKEAIQDWGSVLLLLVNMITPHEAPLMVAPLMVAPLMIAPLVIASLLVIALL